MRALPNRERVPIIALTANAFGDDRQACVEAGMNDFISKPVEPAVLYQCLMTHLGGTESAAATPAAENLEADAARLSAALRELPGVDAAYGLRLLRGKASRYFDLLNSMTLHAGENLERLNEALRTGDLAAAHRLVHTMEGATGGVGAKALHNRLIDLAAALRTGAPPEDLQRLAEAVAIEHQRLATALSALNHTGA